MHSVYLRLTLHLVIQTFPFSSVELHILVCSEILGSLRLSSFTLVYEVVEPLWS